jgi:hypothetical protein
VTKRNSAGMACRDTEGNGMGMGMGMKWSMPDGIDWKRVQEAMRMKVHADEMMDG